MTRTRKSQEVTIDPPNLKVAKFSLAGTTAYVQNKFSSRAREKIEATQTEGLKRTTRTREPREFARDFKEATHFSTDGWYGIPATSFRNALISACKLTGLAMTRAKISIFILADGTDKDGTALVKIIKGTPKMFIAPARNANGRMDLRARPKWEPGWKVDLQIQYDADQFKLDSVANLVARAGIQIGIGAGRPDSKDSNGVGWGLFQFVEQTKGNGRKTKGNGRKKA